MKNRDFWTRYQPGFRFAKAPVGTKEFFDEVTAHRATLEPHIPDVVRFERWTGCDVLEAGCGIGTDGAQFAASGARYTGLDFSPSAIELARRRFDLYDLPGRFVAGSITDLPFPNDTFDLVFSHGVIHHIADTKRAASEFGRVLKPGGTALVMVYHRRSLNYYISILLVRRAFVALLGLPHGVRAVSRITREPEDVLEGHRLLLSTYGVRYIVDRDLFLSHNTDGPGNPLAKVYSRAEALALLPPGFSASTDVRYLNMRLYPRGQWLAGTRLGRVLERRVGWHLYVEAKKDRGMVPYS